MLLNDLLSSYKNQIGAICSPSLLLSVGVVRNVLTRHAYLIDSAEQALRAGPNAPHPNSMHRALQFNGIFVMAVGALVFLIKGSQERKRMDEEKAKEFEMSVH